MNMIDVMFQYGSSFKNDAPLLQTHPSFMQQTSLQLPLNEGDKYSPVPVIEKDIPSLGYDCFFEQEREIGMRSSLCTVIIMDVKCLKLKDRTKEG